MPELMILCPWKKKLITYRVITNDFNSLDQIYPVTQLIPWEWV